MSYCLQKARHSPRKLCRIQHTNVALLSGLGQIMASGILKKNCAARSPGQTALSWPGSKEEAPSDFSQEPLELRPH